MSPDQVESEAQPARGPPSPEGLGTTSPQCWLLPAHIFTEHLLCAGRLSPTQAPSTSHFESRGEAGCRWAEGLPATTSASAPTEGVGTSTAPPALLAQSHQVRTGHPTEPPHEVTHQVTPTAPQPERVHRAWFGRVGRFTPPSPKPSPHRPPCEVSDSWQNKMGGATPPITLTARLAGCHACGEGGACP